MTATTSPQAHPVATHPSGSLLVVLDTTNLAHVLWYGAHGKVDLPLAMKRRCELLQESLGADRVVCAYDFGVSFRKSLCAEYKQQRTPTPENLRVQLRELPDYLSRQGFWSIGGDGFEADDAIATAAWRGCQAGYRVVIVSGDKDVRQCLVPGRVTIAEKLAISRDELHPQWCTADLVMRRYGVAPRQWIDYQCLVGDASDGIHGVPGVGPIHARKLLQAAQSLDRLLAEPMRYAPTLRLRDALYAFRPRADLVKQLVTLRTDCPNVEDAL